MKYFRKFLLYSKNIERDSYIWNTAGSFFIAFQSVILLMVLTRTVGLSDSGIFTLAFSNATMFLYIGKYGMRIYQVSDANHLFSFETYFLSREITVLLMLFSSLVYDIFSTINNGYEIEKSLIIFLMCVFKSSDAVEDVYTSFYQQQNRLDIGAKVTTVRMVVTTVFFALCLVLLHNLLLSLTLSTILTYLLVFGMLRMTNQVFEDELSLSKGFVRREFSSACSLLRICLPLCISAFLPFVISNAPKYAIDSILNDEMQACYGFISMPASAIQLVSNFVFFPLIYTMTQLWTRGKVKQFLRRILIQVGILFLITVLCLGVCYFLGIPVLSLLYRTDLSAYKTELLILVVGGGFMALSELLKYIITIIRKQEYIVWVYVAVSILAMLFSNIIVRGYGITGAALLYTLLMVLLCAGLTPVFVVGLIKERRKSKKELR